MLIIAIFTLEYKGSSNSLSPSLSSSISPKLSAGKLNVSFRPHSHTASPKNNELTNGFKSSNHNNHTSPPSHLSPKKRTTSHSNLTSPVNFYTSNGLSPGLRNSFKNILVKDGTSANPLRRRTTPPTPKSISSTNSPNAISSSTNIDSAPSSRHCSPLAFTFSNDSTSFSNKNSYSNNDEISIIDTNDEDSNSSVFSSFSVDGVPMTNYNNKPSDTNKKKGRKRKIESESDALRENLNSIINSGGRRLQSTHELVQKFNIKLNSSILGKSEKPYNSLSASSSPGVLLNKDGVDYPKQKRRKNGISNGFYDESSNDYDGAISKNKSLPSSPASLSARNFLMKVSPSPLSRNSYDDDDYEYDYKADDIDSRQPSESYYSNNVDKPNNTSNITDIDREIMEIYAKLPKISPEDVTYMQQFSLKAEYTEDEEVECENESYNSKVENKNSNLNCDDSCEYEEFEYDVEYEEEEDVETDVTDSDVDDEEEDDDDDDDNMDFNVAKCHSNSEASNHSDGYDQNSKSDINNCDNLNNHTASDVSQEQIQPSTTKVYCDESNDQQPISSVDDMDVSSSSAFLDMSAHLAGDSDAKDELDVDNSDIYDNEVKCGDSPINETQSNSNENDIGDIEMLSVQNEADSMSDSMSSQSYSKNNDTQPIEADSTQLDVKPSDSLVSVQVKKKKTKTITKRVLKKKYRKCRARSNVKKCLVDRIENEQWEFVNGTYDKDGVWHDFGEMTSAFVLSTGENANNTQEDNVLHILPYVNYSW